MWIGERVSVSAFATVYVDLVLQQEPVPGRTQFVNTSGRAWRVGAEVNADVDLARFCVPCLRPHANVTLVHSAVEPLDDTRIPGQAEWTATAGVSWTPDRLPFAVHLWYGAIGPRTVGPQSPMPELAAVVEPIHRLDAAIDVPLGGGFLLRAFAENLAPSRPGAHARRRRGAARSRRRALRPAALLGPGPLRRQPPRGGAPGSCPLPAALW